jgi:hypothetical protein
MGAVASGIPCSVPAASNIAYVYIIFQKKNIQRQDKEKKRRRRRKQPFHLQHK